MVEQSPPRADSPRWLPPGIGEEWDAQQLEATWPALLPGEAREVRVRAHDDADFVWTGLSGAVRDSATGIPAVPRLLVSILDETAGSEAQSLPWDWEALIPLPTGGLLPSVLPTSGALPGWMWLPVPRVIQRTSPLLMRLESLEAAITVDVALMFVGFGAFGGWRT